jgi:PadR family transcriptional regulator PadR
METKRARGALVQGTLDMLILRTLQHGRAHGHDISKHIRSTSKHVLQVEHGSLYPALHRLERRGLLSGKWEMHLGRKREFKYYRLTAAGRRYLTAQESRWKDLVEAIARVMGAASGPRAVEN